MENYQPISCDFYDELEALATLRRSIRIEYRNEEGGGESVDAVIKDLFIRSKVEYMLLNNGQEIRLDHLLTVDGKALPGFC